MVIASITLEVFRLDRFSYLHQRTKENENGETLEWIKFMNVSVLYSFDLIDISLHSCCLSLVSCCLDGNGHVYIYITKVDKSKSSTYRIIIIILIVPVFLA